ncbi:molybdopterin cofactor-binding domain-containing protein [Ferrovibrio sp. MS7]|uniref:molybdopterin cofactor-binding domain-containing protein n=1 Tax=Ferrovibrio plantarum TaxID=3119164 RepID=UPI0031364C29
MSEVFEKTVGRRIPQIEGRNKIFGRSKYTHDISLPNMLHGAILRSPHASAKICSIDISAAKAMPGVHAVITASDFADAQYVNYGAGYSDRRPMALGRVRFYGEEVAAVAADTLEIAREAVRAIKVDYEVWKPALDVFEAISSNADEIHPLRDGLPRNVAQKISAMFGNVEEEFGKAALIVEGHFEHGIVWPVCMETNAAVASYDKSEEKLEIWAGTQAPFFVRKELARVLPFEREKVVVRSVAVGGGFGGKSQSPEQIAIAALLSIQTCRPVKVVLSRDEEYLAGKTDHAKYMNLRTAVDKHGNILCRTLDAHVDNGAYTHMGPVYISAMRHRITNLYRVKAAAIEANLVYTNKVPGGSYRGMGAPGIIWAIESQVDEVAEKLGLDPVEYRRSIANQPGDETILGWKITSCGLDECLKRSAELIGWKEKYGKLPKYRGVGVASMIHASGSVLYAEGNFSRIALVAYPDGTFRIGTQTADTGTGQNTLLAQLLSDSLGIPMSRIDVLHMDTEESPDDLGSAASRVTFVTGNAVLDAGRKLVAAVKENLAIDWSVPVDAIDYADGRFKRPDAPDFMTFGQAAQRYGTLKVEGFYEIDLARPDAKTGFGNYAASYAFAAQTAEVEVDPETGRVKVLKIASVQDVGKVINLTALEGQTYGGIVQGIGMALSEEVLFQDGRPINRSLFNYRVPRMLDTPDIVVEFVETEENLGPFGAKAAGEPTINATVAAIANAVANATGVRFHKLPITPEMVLEALRKKENAPLPDMKSLSRLRNLEIATVRKAYPAMAPVMKKLGKAIGASRDASTPKRIVQAESIATAVHTLATPGLKSQLIAGGTDLIPGIKQGIYSPRQLVSVGHIASMRKMRLDEGFIRVGAGVTLTALAEDELINTHFPTLKNAILQIATPIVRNRATVAGDLCQEKRCWFFRSATPCYRFSGPACPCYAVLGENRHHSIMGTGRCAAPCVSDLAPIMTALKADLVVVGPRRTRKLPVGELYVWAGETVLDPDEIITEINIPVPSRRSAFHFEKFARWAGDFAEASAAVDVAGTRARLDYVAISLGGVAPKPIRIPVAENILLSDPLSQDLIDEAAKSVVFGALPMKDNAYKAELTINVARRAIAKAIELL